MSKLEFERPVSRLDFLKFAGASVAGIAGIAIATLRAINISESWYWYMAQQIYEQLNKPDRMTRYRELIFRAPKEILLSQYCIEFPAALGDWPENIRYASTTFIGYSRQDGHSVPPDYYGYFLTAGHIDGLFDQKENVNIYDVNGKLVFSGRLDGFTREGDMGILRVHMGERIEKPLTSARELIAPGQDIASLGDLGGLGFILLGIHDGKSERIIWPSQIVQIEGEAILDLPGGVQQRVVVGSGNDARLMSGMSGGPIFTYPDRGKVVGLMSASPKGPGNLLKVDTRGIAITPIGANFSVMFKNFLVGELV